MKKITFLSLVLLAIIACSSSDINETSLPNDSLSQVDDNDSDAGQDSNSDSGQDNNSDSSDNNSNDLNADYNVLFVGNSLTYYNDLPNLVEEEAIKDSIIVKTKMLAYGNYAIVDHWADGEVQQLIKSKKYDFVVIQQGPSSQQNGYDMLVNDGKKYADFCKANNTKLAYFMVWPSRTYYHTFDGVIANYIAGANANNAILCPVGKVWKEHFDTTNDFSYYGVDGFHPSLKGSQVAAKVIKESLIVKKI